MNNKIIDLARKKTLKTLVEDYLERTHLQLEDFYRKHPDKALVVFSRIFQLLCDPDDGIDADDLTADELKGVILEWHPLLTPVWSKINSAFINYRENFLPKQKNYEKRIDEVNNESSSLMPFKDLVDSGSGHFFPDDKCYEIKLKRSPTTIKLSFVSDKFSINMEGIRIVDRFLLQLKDAPIDIFSICEHCGKIIIVTRNGKRFHSGCASKAKQKELWTKDPEVCRKKERDRYHQRVKGR